MPSRTLSLVCSSVLALAGASALAQYKWIDADGHVAYGDQPPRDARKVERIDAANGAPVATDAFSGLPYELRRIAQNFPVQLYTLSGQECPACASARSFLRNRGVPYVERTVGSERDLSVYEALGGRNQFPSLAVGRSFLRTFDVPAWTDALNAAGYPANSLIPPNWNWPAPAPLAPVPAPAPAASAGGS